VLTTTYAVRAAERGERVAMFAFDEGVGTLFARAKSMSLPLEQHANSGLVQVQQIDPAELSPGEFVDIVRRAVERDNVRLLVIDSLNGYLQAMPEEQFLTAQLHELLTYLRQRGVLTILVVAQHGLLGQMAGPIDVSYLADTVVLTRYFEARGHVRKAISVVKKRAGAHENAIRELALGPDGVRVGPPLSRFRGILSGIPNYDPGSDGELLSSETT
jgi:circadian clock protein KaiC